jgi:hypothetical protein
LFFVKRYFLNMAGVSGVQSLASARPIRLILIKCRPVAAEMSDYRNLPAKMGTADPAGQSACQAAPIVAIVVQTISDPAMHCVLFFTRHFYFSDSSPEAVE